MEPTIINKNFLNTSFGKICYRSVGNKSDPLYLIVHGSGVNNSGKVYEEFLFEYGIRFNTSWPIFMVAMDCPGYGESTGLKSVIRGFPEKFLREFMKLLTGNESCFILMGHSQGGYSIFNAAVLNNKITNFLVQDRPVCGNIKKLVELKTPTFLVYDEEDDGHPIKQGKEIIRVIKNYKFFSYKGSENPYWFSDRLIDEILKFLHTFQSHISDKKNTPNFKLITEINGIEFTENNNKEITERKKFSTERVNENKCKEKTESASGKQSSENIEKENQKDVQSNIINEHSQLKIRSKSLSENVRETLEHSNEIYKKSSSVNKNLKDKENAEKNLNNLIQNLAIADSKDKIINITPLVEPINEKDKEEEVSSFSDNPDENEDKEIKCPLCLDFYIKPIKLPCNHIFCLYCIDTSLLYNPICPMCRKTFPSEKLKEILNEKNISVEVQDNLRRYVDQEYLIKREEIIINERKKQKNKTIIIEYGNTCVPLNPNKAKGKCQWTLYVKVVSSPVKNPVKSVEFDINPHLQGSPAIKVTAAPFEFERNGSYEFPLNIKVNFQDSLKLEPYVATHGLKLNAPKTNRNFLIKIK